MAQRQEQAVEPHRIGREGARWINQRPTPEEFAHWFNENVKVDPALNADDYVGGMVLIPGVDEKSKYVKGWHDGNPVIGERAELSYTPYPQVGTRIAYFWDLIEAHNDWTGVLEPVKSPRVDTSFYSTNESRMDGDRVIERSNVRLRHGTPLDHLVAGLPPGFFIMSVPVGQGYTHFLAMQYHCAIYQRGREKPIREGWGTQQIGMLKGRREHYADPDLIAKAETSAKGRAIHAAGIFVIPGAGVATAEDMIESQTSTPTPPQRPAETPTTAQETAEPTESTGQPSQVRTGAEQVADEREQLLERARALARELQTDFPGTFEAFTQWANALRPPMTKLSEARGARLRGVVTRLERMLDEAKRQQAERGEQPAGDTSQEEGNDGSTEAPTGEQPTGP